MATTRRKSTSKSAAAKRQTGEDASAKRQTAESSAAKRAGGTDERHPVEWAVGAVSALLIVALLVYLGYRAISVDSSPPRFRMNVETISEIDGRFHVFVALTNQGGSAAADVEVEGTLPATEGGVETSSFRIDYLPQGSTRRGTLLFTRDPSGGRLDLSVHGYSKP